jgi:hemoglobin-like flavoprotein
MSADQAKPTSFSKRSACDGFSEPERIFLVQKSFEHISEHSREFGERFYKVLFEMYQEFRRLFEHNLDIQTRMLVSMLASIVKGLNRLPEIVGGLRELGKRHKEYSVRRDDYDKVARALLKTLEEFLGEGFTIDIRQAWLSVYGEIVSVMTENLDE